MSRLCTNFVQAGYCRFGDRCIFKHGNNDTRDLNALSKTKPCRNFQMGNCRFGASCKFSHDNSGGGHSGGQNRGHGGQSGGRRGHGGRGSYQRGGHRGGRGASQKVVNGVAFKHTLASEGLKVYIENRVSVRMQTRKMKVFKDLLARGSNGSAWRGLHAHLPEIVAFGGSHMHKMVLAISGVSQNKPNTLYVFFFETNTGKQEHEFNRLKADKHRLGAGNFFSQIFTACKGTTDMSKIVLKKTAQELKEDQEEKERKEKEAYDALNTMEALDKQVAEIAAKAAAKKAAIARGEVDSSDDDSDFVDDGMMDAFM